MCPGLNMDTQGRTLPRTRKERQEKEKGSSRRPLFGLRHPCCRVYHSSSRGCAVLLRPLWPQSLMCACTYTGINIHRIKNHKENLHRKGRWGYSHTASIFLQTTLVLKSSNVNLWTYKKRLFWQQMPNMCPTSFVLFISQQASWEHTR